MQLWLSVKATKMIITFLTIFFYKSKKAGSCTRFRKTQSRMDTIPNEHHPVWTQYRMDTIPNGPHPEWTPSRVDTIPNGHYPEWTPSEMARSPMSTYSYIITLVFYSYCLVRPLLRRRGFKQKLILIL